MMLARAFNERGMLRFRQFLEQYQEGTVYSDDVMKLVRDTSLSNLWEQQRLEINLPQIASKKELAQTVCDSFEKAGYTELPIRRGSESSRGLWTWLAAYAFHLIRTRNANKRLREYAYYIADQQWNRIYRHRVAAPARHCWLFRDKVRNANLLLYGPAHQLSDWEEQVGSRLDRIRNRELVIAMNHLYWDPKVAKPKRGAQNRDHGGTLRRFLRVMSQLELTYDLQSLAAEQILDLLPPEFDRWKN